MKTWLLFSIPAVALVIGWSRQSGLTRLIQENERLESFATQPHGIRSSIHHREIPISETRDAALRLHALQLKTETDASDHETARALLQKIRDGLTGREPSEVQRFIEETTAGMNEAERRAFIYHCIVIYAKTDPAAALELTISLADYPGRADDLRFTLSRCLPVDPKRVVDTFDRLSAEGEPITRDRRALNLVFAAQARVDPQAAVARLLSSEEALPPGDLMQISDAILRELRNPAEHKAFFTALHVESSTHPGAPRLEELRKRYQAELAKSIIGWPVEDALPLIDSKFTPEEKISFCRQLQQSEEPGAWADWVAGLGAEDKREHPIGSLVKQWSRQDFGETVAWLNRQPEGPVRTTAVKNLAMGSSDIDPETIAKIAMTLPPGKDKDQALAAVRNVWKKKDPAAHAAFADQHGLKK